MTSFTHWLRSAGLDLLIGRYYRNYRYFLIRTYIYTSELYVNLCYYILYLYSNDGSEVAVKWKDWCSERFMGHWGELLSRPETKADSQYDNIKSLYEAALSKGASMKQRIRKRKSKAKKPRRRNMNPWAKK